MKQPTTHHFAGVTATVYQLEKGEKVPRHQHPNEHNTSVISGCSEVEIWWGGALGNLTYRMLPGENPWVLPANLDHEVRALETPTIVIHMMQGTYHSVEGGAPGPHAGVMLEDETVIPHGG